MQFPVETVRVQDRDAVYTLNAVGSVEAFEKVQVTARVAGVVEKVQFAEGSRVAAGQVLVEIEPQRYTLAVASAQAAHNKAVAAKSDAEAGLKRRETVDQQNPGLIPGEEIEAWRTKVLVAAAEMAQTNAALNQAQLNLHDAFVRAPVPGVVQTRTVQTGQYVQPGSVMATLVRRDPLLLRFQATEQDAVRLQPGVKAFFKVRDSDREYQARIIHVAASTEESTRMVAVTAEVSRQGQGEPALRLVRRGAGAGGRLPPPAGRAADGHPPQREGLPGLRGGERQGRRAHPDARHAHRRRQRGGPLRAEGRRPAGGARRRGPERRRGRAPGRGPAPPAAKGAGRPVK